jgi:hypothetical protein
MRLVKYRGCSVGRGDGGYGCRSSYGCSSSKGWGEEVIKAGQGRRAELDRAANNTVVKM